MQLLGLSPVTDRAQTLAQAQAAASTGAGSSASSSSAAGSLTSEQTFLQLLVAQIQNQDPLNPTDSIQFVGQLVQYSELEQLIGINQGIQSLTGSGASTSSANSKTQTSSQSTQSI